MSRYTLFLTLLCFDLIQSFQLQPLNSSRINSYSCTRSIFTYVKSTDDGLTTNSSSEEKIKKRKREKVMSFLRNVGAVGKNKDFSTAIGVDEGPLGKNNDPVKVCVVCF